MFEARDQANILLDGKVGKQASFLNDVSDSAAKAGWVGGKRRLAFDEHLAGGRQQHPINKAKEGSFAAATAAEEDQGFAARDAQRDIYYNGANGNIVYVKARI